MEETSWMRGGNSSRNYSSVVFNLKKRSDPDQGGIFMFGYSAKQVENQCHDFAKVNPGEG